MVSAMRNKVVKQCTSGKMRRFLFTSAVTIKFRLLEDSNSSAHAGNASGTSFLHSKINWVNL